LVRKLEVQISRYQDLLRQKIYQSEMNIYHQIGESRFEEFYEYYEEEFKEVIYKKIREIILFSSIRIVWRELLSFELNMKIN